ncbi:MAG TPA: acyltransferase domain-containing protein [Buchnera sp. (in: enterobacteria)]|nr:acyltransferase domain-containing protein [Buchnera sp. (in: enterobacteria)]
MEKKNEKIPNIAAGHSLGEYSALVCSNSISLKDGLKTVIQRNKLMQESAKNNPGSMMAIIGMKKKIIKKICKNFFKNEFAAISSINSDTEIVVSGNKKKLHKIEKICKLLGAKAVFHLSINIPSHCILMKNASKKFSKFLKNIFFKKPDFPIINNVDVKYEKSNKKIKTALIRQLVEPINWKKSINFILKKKKLFYY